MNEEIIEKLLNDKNNIIDTAAKLISYKSIKSAPLKGMPFGKECNECLEYTLDICQSFGMKTKNIDGYIGYAEIGEGEELIGILTHLDVVPVGDDWDYDPFKLTIVDDKIYGRGILDDKGPAAICIHILKEIKASKIKLNKRIRLIFGLDEESDWECVNRYLKTEERPTYGFTPDADFPIIKGEKGILALKISGKPQASKVITKVDGGNAINSVPASASATLVDKSIIKAEGKAAHGSMPWLGENAIANLVEKLALYYKERNLEIDHNLLKFYHDCIKDEYYGQSLGCAYEDEQSGQLTFSANIININENEASLEVDIRYPITCNVQQIKDIITPILKSYNLTMEILDYKDPIYLDDDNFLVKELLAVYNEVMQANEKAVVIGGGTYARAMDNIVAFGPLFPNTYDSAHQKNEHLEYDSFIKSIEIYAKAILKLLDK